MHRPYEHLTDVELGSEFSQCCKLGGRPVMRRGDQYAYADLVMEILMEEFGYRSRLLVDDVDVVDDNADYSPF